MTEPQVASSQPQGEESKGWSPPRRRTASDGCFPALLKFVGNIGFIASVILGLYNVYGPVEEILDLARVTACQDELAGCKAMWTMWERRPWMHFLTMQAAGKTKMVKCRREYILLGAWSCSATAMDDPVTPSASVTSPAVPSETPPPVASAAAPSRAKTKRIGGQRHAVRSSGVGPPENRHKTITFRVTRSRLSTISGMNVLDARRAELLDELIKLRPDIRNFLASLGYHRDGAAYPLDDAVQSVMAKAIERLPSYRAGEGGLRRWTFGIAVNVAREEKRLERRRWTLFAAENASDKGPACPDSSPEQTSAARELLQRAARAMARLPETLCIALAVVVEEGGSQDLALKLSISEDAARKRLERARDALEQESGIARSDLRAMLPFLFVGEAEQTRRWFADLSSITEISLRGSRVAVAVVAAWLLWPQPLVHTAHKANLSTYAPAFVTTTSIDAPPPVSPPPSAASRALPRDPRVDKPQALASQTSPTKTRERVDIDVKGLTFKLRP